MKVGGEMTSDKRKNPLNFRADPGRSFKMQNRPLALALTLALALAEYLFPKSPST